MPQTTVSGMPPLRPNDGELKHQINIASFLKVPIIGDLGAFEIS
jgi:hypothetical protein